MSLFLDIEKRLGAFQLRVKLEAADETLALLGASGCGKSMTLRCIAGIETPDRGKIVVNGVTLFDSEQHINLSPQARKTGLLFQNYSLFPNMTVLQNIQAGAKRESDVQLRKAAVAEIMRSFGISALADRYPHQLSGGQQQRVALARILVSNPQILLLDEPFSALDAHLRFQLEEEVRQVIRQFGKTVLLVSHDRGEVFRMSDSVAIMNQGCIDTIGPRHTVFQNPGTIHAAILTGCPNISPVEILDAHRVKATAWNLVLTLEQPTDQISAIGLHARSLRFAAGKAAILCQVTEEIENPESYTILLRPEGAPSPLVWELDKEDWHKIKSSIIGISLPQKNILRLNEGA